MRPSGPGLENVHFLEYSFVLGIHCHDLGKFVSFWRVSVRPSGAGLENVHFLEYTFVLDIHIANNWGVLFSGVLLC